MSTPFSIGSTWTSLALLLIALFTTRSTRSMIGAASLRSFSPATGSKTSSSGRRASPVSPAAFAPGRPPRAAPAARGTASQARRPGVVCAERLVGVAGLNRLDDVAARRDDLLDAVAGLEFEILHEAEEQRIRHRHRQQVLLEADGDADALERDFFRNQNDGGRIGRVFGEVDVRKAELEGEGLRDLLLGREIHAHEHHAQAFARALVLGQRGAEILFRDEARLNQALTDFLTQP